MKLTINCADELTVARIVAALKREDLRLVSRQKNARVGEVRCESVTGEHPHHVEALLKALPAWSVRAVRIELEPRVRLHDLHGVKQAALAQGDQMTLTRAGDLLIYQPPADHIPPAVRALFGATAA